jgi:hypothetical protein
MSTVIINEDSVTSQQLKNNCFEGIEMTNQLHILLQKAIAISNTMHPIETDDTNPSSNQDDIHDNNKENTSQSLQIGNNDINKMLHEIKSYSLTTKLPMNEAISILQKQEQHPQPTNKKKVLHYISVPVLRSMETIFDYIDTKDNNVDRTPTSPLLVEFNSAIQNPAQLIYATTKFNNHACDIDNDDDNNDENQNDTTDTPSTLTKEQIKFQLRMQKLRLKNEERKYMKLTNNVNTQPIQDDMITTKSMTYAASIGLNMIVAPISFGVFMYFFAGSLLDYFWPSSLSNHRATTDIRKVIAGVVSGVLMLFIEMILFVIRTHEVDKAMMLKQKKKRNNNTDPSSLSPFGHYTSKTTKTYIDR